MEKIPNPIDPNRKKINYSSRNMQDFHKSSVSFSALHRIQELRAQGDPSSANSILKEWIVDN